MRTGEIDLALIRTAVAPTYPDEAAHAVFAGGPASPSRTLWDILETTAATFPRAPAIDDGSCVHDYSALLREVRRLRDRLDSVGIGPGDRVGVRIPSGTADLYVSILAVLAVGAAYLPVEMDDPDDRAELVWSEAAVCSVIGSGREITPRAVPPTAAAARRPVPQDDAWAQDHPDGGRLAGDVRAQEARHRPALHVEAEVADRLDGAEPFGTAPDLDDRHARSLRCERPPCVATSATNGPMSLKPLSSRSTTMMLGAPVGGRVSSATPATPAPSGQPARPSRHTSSSRRAGPRGHWLLLSFY
jgi:AMP-binding enzyme